MKSPFLCVQQQTVSIQWFWLTGESNVPFHFDQSE